VLLATFFVLLQGYFSARTFVEASFATGWLFASWMHDDAARRETDLPRVLLALCFVGWPLVFPLYVVATRRGRFRLYWVGAGLLWALGTAALGVALGWLPATEAARSALP
jgi:hypothetical protein